MIQHPPGLRAAWTVLATAIVSTVILAACSAGPAGSGVVSLSDPSASPGSNAAPSASIDPADAMQAYAACMRKHGVDVQVSSATAGDAGVSGGGPITNGAAGPAATGAPAGAQAPQQGQGGAPDKEAFGQADEACHGLLPAAGLGDPQASMDPKIADQMLAFAKCMRDHGVDYPDPKFENGGMTVQIGGDGSGVDPSSQKFQDAQKACSSLAPDGGPIGGAGSNSVHIGAGAPGTNP